jgi:hypothetical protein
MKNLYVTTFIALITTTSIGYAGSVDDAEAGSAAFERGDYPAADRLFSRALSTGRLTAADRESALVMRARARISESRDDLALKDVEQALKLKPNDQEATNLKRQLQGDAERKAQTSAPEDEQAQPVGSTNLLSLACKGTSTTFVPTALGYSKSIQASSSNNEVSFILNIDLDTGDVTYSTSGKTYPHLATITTDSVVWQGSLSLPEIENSQPAQVTISRSSGAFSEVFNFDLLTETLKGNCAPTQPKF